MTRRSLPDSSSNTVRGLLDNQAREGGAGKLIVQGSADSEIVRHESHPLRKRVVSVRQKETFFNNQECRVIFIEDIVVENLLGNKETALQLYDRIADFLTKKISLPLNLISESASKLTTN